MSTIFYVVIAWAGGCVLYYRFVLSDLSRLQRDHCAYIIAYQMQTYPFHLLLDKYDTSIT